MDVTSYVLCHARLVNETTTHRNVPVYPSKTSIPPRRDLASLGGTGFLGRRCGQLQDRRDDAHDVQEVQLVPNCDLREEELKHLFVR